ncbi:uncharacterized protein A4U43_C03F1990 [Asparagus officinalis]|uniref:Uncharacterized protein n=1 Tax=Asparagus officinalis TaxID=4686 RepID=A0A5P1F766_ASPOF|nr:uncharacterized protein LOC109832700 isoform X2 [Asparagus officinalis]ONK74022.1 uncharacterized protein A4U43_C03F1990 [Asparagus officinalis]
MASPNSKTLTLKPSASTSFTEERLREYNRRRQASSSSNPYLYLRSLGLSPGRESFASSARTSASSSSVLLMIQEWTPSCLLLLHCFEITVVSLSLSLSLSLFLRQIRMNLGVSGMHDGGAEGNRSKKVKSEDTCNHSDKGEEDVKEEEARKNRLGLNKKSGDDDELIAKGKSYVNSCK